MRAARQSKLRGGYYTPSGIADLLCGWAIVSPDAAVLEPSAGDGAFVEAAARRLGWGRIDAVELFGAEAAKITARAGGKADVSSGDAFAWYSADRDATYDAVVGNPPFIRFQAFPEAHRSRALALMRAEGLRPTRLTNAWVPFVVLATRALRPGGRLAMVLPAELLQVSYAAELRGYLPREYRELTIVTFRRLVFAGIQEETVLLFGVRGDGLGAATMSFLELGSVDALTPDDVGQAERAPVDLDHTREKWTQYYLSARELGLVRDLETSGALTTLGALADVDVGVVTGRNDFFVLSPSQAASVGMTDACVPLVGRSAQVPGLVFGDDEWQGLAETDARCLLLQLGRTPRARLSKDARAYVQAGERAGYHEGFKCRVRQPTWWYVPSTQRPDAFMLRQVHDGPRIVANASAATCTDTIHRVRVREGIDAGWLATASMNSVTFAFSEIRGRSYGGGVLELEPNEADALPFPRPGVRLPVADLDLWSRRKDTEQVLNEVDRLVLREAGLDAHDIAVVRAIWRKLRDRRLSRSSRRRSAR